MDMSKFNDGKVHFRNSGVKDLMPVLSRLFHKRQALAVVLLLASCFHSCRVFIAGILKLLKGFTSNAVPSVLTLGTFL